MTISHSLSTIILLIIAESLTTTNAQFLPYPYFAPNAVAVADLPPNCSASYARVNASGTYSLGPSFVNGDWNGGSAREDLSWTVTVGQIPSTGELRSSHWLGTPPGIDFRSGSLGYSGCAISLGGISQNLIRRAQSDNGDCTTMLNDQCVNALQKQLQTIALSYVATWTDNSPAPSNLSAGSLPRVCSNIQNDFTAKGAVPSECARFVGSERSWYDGSESNVTFTVTPITGPNSTTDNTCTFNTSSVQPNFAIPSSNLSLITQQTSSLKTTNATRIEETYDKAVTLVSPIITILFPPANDTNRASGTVSQAEAFLTCARPSNITSGSRVAAALPAPTPLRKLTRRLGPGAKAGIAVGVVLAVLLIGGLVAYWCMSRRSRSRERLRAQNLEMMESKMRREREEVQEAKTPMLGGEERVEIGGDVDVDVKGATMLDGTQRYEAPGLVGHELEGGRVYAELDGSSAAARKPR